MEGLTGADVLIVFVKEPRPGAVKSRLAATIGPDHAAAIYRAMAREAIRRTAPRRDDYERVFFFAPAEAEARISDWLPGERLAAQAAGDLGVRMSEAFTDVFASGARRVAIIGTDVPWIDHKDVAEALESLDDHEVVIGPATDGGYYLLALRRPEPELFREVPWSTPGVLTITLERAGALGRSVRVLRTLGDVDTFEDLAADWPRLASLLPERVREEVGAMVRRRPFYGD